MLVKISELIGPALDWAVAKCEGALRNWPNYTVFPSYSNDWAQGGPIIERERIDINYSNQEGSSGEIWDAACEVNKVFGGPTALIAAMRCYVASKMGDEVEIPEELTK
jgi:hypothetical protein